MPTYTLNPATEVSNTIWGVVGAASRLAAISDNDDASYIRHLVDSGEGARNRSKVGSVSFPANEVIKQVTFRIRGRSVTSNTTVIFGWEYNGNKKTSSFVFTPTLNTYSAVRKTSPWTGQTWQKAEANNIIFDVLHSSQAVEARVMKVWAEVLTCTPPSVSGIQPSGGTVSVATPTLSWDYTPGTDGGPQAFAVVKVFEQSVFSGPGFNPDTSPAHWSSIVPATSVTITTPLSNGASYRVYVRPYQDLGNGFSQAGSWTNGSTFTTLFDTPARPVFSTSLNADGSVTISGRAADNLLSVTDAGLEHTSAGNWASQTLCSVASSSAQARIGTRSLAMTASGSGSMVARLGGTASGTRYGVQAGRSYRFMAWARHGSTSRTAKVRVLWYDSSGTQVGSTANSADVTINNTGWTQVSGLFTAPASAVEASLRLVVDGVSAGEVAYWDTVGFFDTTGGRDTSEWSGGGFVPWPSGLTDPVQGATPYTRKIRIRRNYTTFVRQGVQVPVTFDADQTFVLVDHEVRPGTTPSWEVWAIAWSPAEVEGPAATGTGPLVAVNDWWLKCPSTPSLNTQVRVVTDGSLASSERAGVFLPIRSTSPVVLVDFRGPGNRDGIIIETLTAAEAEALQALIEADQVLLLVGPSNLGIPTFDYLVLRDVQRERMSALVDSTWLRWTLNAARCDAPAVVL